METNYDLKNTEAQINKGNSNNQNAKYLYIICIYLYCNLFTAMNLVGSTWHHYASFYRSTSWDSGHGISFWQPETKVVTSSGKLWKVATKVIFRRFHSWCAAMFIVRLFLSVSVCFICGFAKCLLCFQLRNNIWIFSVFFCIWDFFEHVLESYLWVSPRTSCYWRCKPWMQGQDNLTNKKQHKSSRRIQGDKTKRPRTSECPLRPRCENMRKVKYRILSSRKHIMNMTSLFQTKWVFLLNSTECFFQAQPWDSFNLRQV